MISAEFVVERDDFLMDIKLEIPSTGATVLFGPSGSGKTTFINVLSGIVKPLHGLIKVGNATFFDSENKINLPMEKRGIGYVFQDGRLFPHMSVEENLDFGRKRSNDKTSRKQEIIELLGLGQLLQRKPSTLSGGERQRTAIGRAILSGPSFLFMDEPLAALDFARKQEILPYIATLKKNLKIPIIYVSHQMEEVVRLADHLVLLENGKILDHGQIFDIINSPSLGILLGKDDKTSLINCHVDKETGKDGLSKLVFPGGYFLVTQRDLAPLENVRIELKAQDVALALEKPIATSIANILEASVAKIETSKDTHCDVLLSIGNVSIWARITQQSASKLGLKIGSQVFALIKSAAIRPF